VVGVSIGDTLVNCMFDNNITSIANYPVVKAEVVDIPAEPIKRAV
jgi:hypothetical protein